MNISKEVLETYNLSEQSIENFVTNYNEDDDFEMIDVIKNENVSIDLIMDIRNHLPMDKEEFAAYVKRCNITNSQNVVLSYNVESSNFVFNSNNVTKCDTITKSSQITNSEYIDQSSMINNCTYIQKGNMCNNSKYIYDSINISDSNNIVLSNFIMNSVNIFRGGNIVNCYCLRKCINMENSIFCAECTNISNALFCYQLAAEEVDNNKYYLFNKPISKIQFDNIFKQYEAVAKNIFARFTDTWYDNNIEDFNIKLHYNYSLYYRNLTNITAMWIKSLPYCTNRIIEPIFGFIFE